MTQQIDFLKSLPKIQIRFPAILIFILFFSLMLVLICITIGLKLYQHELEHHFIQAHQDKITAEQELQVTQAKFPLLAGHLSLVERISNEQAHLNSKMNYFKSLARLTARHGFSEYLIALGQAIPSNLWLSSIIIDQNLITMGLQGYTLNVSNVSLLSRTVLMLPIFNDFHSSKYTLVKLHPGCIKFSMINRTNEASTPESTASDEKS